MTYFFAAANTAPTNALSLGSVLLIVLPATIALMGVIASTVVSTVTTHRAEDRRARNAVFSQVLEAGRAAELQALYATADFIARLKDFNRAMMGNSGEGEDDDKSSAAFSNFVDAFDGFDPLTRAAVTVQALGATSVSDRIDTIRNETLSYAMALRPPVFYAEQARTFEARVDSLMKDLIEEVRRDFGVNEARAIHQGKKTRRVGQ